MPNTSAADPIAALQGQKSNPQQPPRGQTLPQTSKHRYPIRSKPLLQNLPARSTKPDVSAAPLANKSQILWSLNNQTPLQHLPAPIPTASYLTLASVQATPLPSPQPLLLVLDLNGTLVHRRHASSTYTPRPFLPNFLAYCLANHSLLIWSSATPPNVSAICGKLFQPEERSVLLGEWGRDTFDLTPEHYRTKVQVYKRLDRIWEDPILSATHPLAHQGHKWCQRNTLLIDDSVLKASAQPYNLVEIPCFIKNQEERSKMGKKKKSRFVLEQVIWYLEEAKTFSDVSAFARTRPFQVNSEWAWDRTQQEISKPTMAAGRSATREEEDEHENEDSCGGVKLG